MIKRPAVRVVLALLAIGFIRAGYDLATWWRQSTYSMPVLRAASEQVNKTLPAAIGTQLQLVHTSASDGRFVYQLRLLNSNHLQSAAVKQEMTAAACANDKARDMLRHQVRLLYQIAGSDGTPLASIEIAAGDCGV